MKHFSLGVAMVSIVTCSDISYVAGPITSLERNLNFLKLSSGWCSTSLEVDDDPIPHRSEERRVGKEC